jgi:hypothetical protein
MAHSVGSRVHCTQSGPLDGPLCDATTQNHRSPIRVFLRFVVLARPTALR